MKLSDEELADITQHNGKKIKGKENERKSEKIEISSFPKAAAAPQSAPHALPNEASAVSSRALIKYIFWRTVSQEQRNGLTLKYIQAQCDGFDTHEQCDGLSSKRRRDWTFPASAKIEYIWVLPPAV